MSKKNLISLVYRLQLEKKASINYIFEPESLLQRGVCSSSHPSHCKASLPNANTGPGLPIIISTLSKEEGNAMCNRL